MSVDFGELAQCAMRFLTHYDEKTGEMLRGLKKVCESFFVRLIAFVVKKQLETAVNKKRFPIH